ncbi:MAG: hypothetical protein IM610_05345 [Cytophagales bacterium]|nr:hypothetical protein [Cytophagales bacterium]
MTRFWLAAVFQLTVPHFAFSKPSSVWSQETRANEIKVASYNVLNLFDTEKDQDKDDWTFLPRAFPGKKEACKKIKEVYYREQCLSVDWTEPKLAKKIDQIKKSLDLQGDLPDILGVYEIENRNVATMLQKHLGYSDFKMTDSLGSRGIDVALFFRSEKLELLEESHLRVPQTTTRDILRLKFGLRGNSNAFYIYANHWPSMAAPAQERVRMARFLIEDMQRLQQVYGKNIHLIAMGDFNTPEDESPNAFKDVVHAKGSPVQLFDAEALGRLNSNPAVSEFPQGTYWYQRNKKWKKFDRIIYSSTLKDGSGLEALPESFRIHFPQEIRMKRGGMDTPWTFDFTETNQSKMGYADHLPLIQKFRF